jgi:hypothetical protein
LYQCSSVQGDRREVRQQSRHDQEPSDLKRRQVTSQYATVALPERLGTRWGGLIAPTRPATLIRFPHFSFAILGDLAAAIRATCRTSDIWSDTGHREGPSTLHLVKQVGLVMLTRKPGGHRLVSQ